MHKNVLKNLQLAKTFLILRKKIEEIREVSHFENGIEHKILITHVIAKVSGCENTQGDLDDDLLRPFCPR